MAECLNPSEMSKWIPVVGTLLGAAIGFVGGLFNSWLTQTNRESTERENRERGRLENLYETLIEVRRDYQGLLSQMISKVHFNKELTLKERPGIPPLVKLDMVIHMYFPALTEVHRKFVAAKERFGEKWGENVVASFSGESLETKQRLCGEYTRLFAELNSEISKSSAETGLDG